MTSGRGRTFYLPAGTEKRWDQYLKLCDLKLGTSGSKRINTLWLNDLKALEGADAPIIEYNLEEKITQRLALQKKEKELLNILQQKPTYGPPPYHGLISLAVQLGTDPRLGKDLPMIREKIIDYEVTELDQFTDNHRMMFIALIDILLKRRALTEEIKRNLKPGDVANLTKLSFSN